jgi:hypothetical protein
MKQHRTVKRCDGAGSHSSRHEGNSLSRTSRYSLELWECQKPWMPNAKTQNAECHNTGCRMRKHWMPLDLLCLSSFVLQLAVSFVIHLPICRAAVLSFWKGMISTETFLAFRLNRQFHLYDYHVRYRRRHGPICCISLIFCVHGQRCTCSLS